MDSEIQVSESSGFNGGLNAVGLGITDLTGIEAFTNLSDFSAANNMLTSVDLSQNINLVEIRLSVLTAGLGYISTLVGWPIEEAIEYPKEFVLVAPPTQNADVSLDPKDPPEANVVLPSVKL